MTKDEQNDIRKLVEQIMSDSSRSDIDNEGEARDSIGRLPYNADNVSITNKINELINAFNKGLSDYRV